VRSAKRRHQSPEWTILSHVNCFIQEEVIGFQDLLDSLHPRSTRVSWWSPTPRGGAFKISCQLYWHFDNVGELGEMPCLDNSRKLWFPGCPSHLIIPQMWFLIAFVSFIDREHQSSVHHSHVVYAVYTIKKPSKGPQPAKPTQLANSHIHC